MRDHADSLQRIRTAMRSFVALMTRAFSKLKSSVRLRSIPNFMNDISYGNFEQGADVVKYSLNRKFTELGAVICGTA